MTAYRASTPLCPACHQALEPRDAPDDAGGWARALRTLRGWLKRE